MAAPAARLAHRVLADNLNVQKGESVLIESWTHSLPYARAFVAEARRLGARPTVLYEDEQAWWDAVESGKPKAVGAFSKAEKAAVKAADVYVFFWGPEDRTRMAKLPDELQDKITAYNNDWYKTAHKAGLRGVRMQVGLATEPAAKEYGVDVTAWRNQMVEAGAVNANKIRTKGERLGKLLQKGSELRIRHSNGTDVRMELDGVNFRVRSGLLTKKEMRHPFGMMADNPAGQILVGLDRSRATGTIVSNRAVYLGPNQYDGVRWTLQNGRLVKHTYEKGGEVFDAGFAKAGKGRDRLGLISIGLNPKGKALPPSEDTEEGAVLFGVGDNGIGGGTLNVGFQGYALLGGATIEVDGNVIAKGGVVR